MTACQYGETCPRPAVVRAVIARTPTRTHALAVCLAHLVEMERYVTVLDVADLAAVERLASDAPWLRTLTPMVSP